LGWSQNETATWLLRAGEQAKDSTELREWWDQADVVLCSERSLDLFSARLNSGKLTFYMSERWWKPPIGRARLLHPPFLKMALTFRHLAASPLFHFLAIGANAARDIRFLTPFPNRLWRWGYFTPEPVTEPLAARGGQGFSVLWAGRMLRWKRVDTLLRAFALLAEHAESAHLTLIGYGPLEPRLRALADRLNLRGRVTFLPSCAAADVRRWMRASEVFVLPSSSYEGWGAVVNEAMAEGCVVVASSVAGSAMSVIRDGQNGLLFNPGDYRQLAGILSQLYVKAQRRKDIAAAGQRTILDEWSPGIAAARFLRVSEALLAGAPTPLYAAGPMAGDEALNRTGD